MRRAEWREKPVKIVPEPDETVRTLRYDDGIFRTGEDRAILEVVDGWLVCRGGRADWALRPVDAGISGTSPAILHWRAPDGTSGRVVIGTMNLGGELRYALTGDRRAVSFLREWIAGPIPVGEPVWPPSRPMPRQWFNAWTSVGIWGLLTVLMISMASVPCVAPLLALAVWRLLRFRRAWVGRVES